MTNGLRLITELLAALVGIATLIFLAFAVVPVDPARTILGPNASEEAVQTLRREYGLDAPLPARYFQTMTRLLRGDFGQSFYFDQPAGTVVRGLAPITLGRTGLALVLGFVVGMGSAWCLGVLGLHRWGRPLLVTLQSVPSFCAMLLILWFCSRAFGGTPIGSTGLYEFMTILGASAYPAGAVGYYVLERMSPVEGTPRHIEFLRMLGAPRRYQQVTMLRDAVPGAFAITVNALSVVLTAVSFAELIFGLRGFGIVFIRSCERGDLSVVIAGSMILCAMVILVQRIADAVLRTIDPRFASV